MAKLRRPTRTDLLAVVGHLQEVLGALLAAKGDRNPNRAAEMAQLADYGLNVCIQARSFDPPTAGSRSPWAKLEIPKVKP
jgi:hypothetical protein